METEIETVAATEGKLPNNVCPVVSGSIHYNDDGSQKWRTGI